LQRNRQSGVTLIEMLIVAMIIAVIAGISFPSLTSGLSSIRLSSAAGSTASFLTAAMNTVERTENAAAVVISPKDNQIEVFTAVSGEKPVKTLAMPQGIKVDGNEEQRFVLEPGGTFPRITVFLRSDKGARRSVKVDPATGVPDIQRVSGDAK
jgi:prepilin-type N-terminal cleavage/methylation domain-containing protein